MRRFALAVVALLFLIVIAAIALSIFAPHLLTSLKDRSARVLKDVAPTIGERLTPRAPMALNDILREKGVRRGQPVFIRIFKQSSELELHMRGDEGWILVKTYPVCRWSGGLGPKLREGDGQSPEGFYVVTRRALNPNSSYHLSFNLGFPNAFDRANGRTGSFLMVHGDCLSIGCYAMTDAGIEEIYGLVDAALRAGQAELPVHVFPFRMTAEHLMRHRASPHAAFWANLKEGHDWFEATRRPPLAHVCDKAYVFSDGSAPAGRCQRILGM
jgi:murein L,D-transpeptidase YafK